MPLLRILLEGGGPDTSLAWLLYTGIAAFLMVMTVGWVTAQQKPPKLEDRPKRKLDRSSRKKPK